jgi:hypothetical protein
MSNAKPAKPMRNQGETYRFKCARKAVESASVTTETPHP